MAEWSGKIRGHRFFALFSTLFFLPHNFFFMGNPIFGDSFVILGSTGVTVSSLVGSSVAVAVAAMTAWGMRPRLGDIGPKWISGAGPK